MEKGKSITFSENGNIYWKFENGTLFIYDDYEFDIRSDEDRTSDDFLEEDFFKDFYSEVKYFEVSEGNYLYESDNGILYSKGMDTLLRVPPKMKGSIIIPDCVTNIEFDAFRNCCYITKIRIPEHLGFIDAICWKELTSLESFDVDTQNRHYTSEEGVLYSKEMSEILCVPCGKKGILKIPDSVIRIGHRSFSYCAELEKVVIPESVDFIGYMAFASCKKIESLVIPESVTLIGEKAFCDCNNLISAVIPDCITTLFVGDWWLEYPTQNVYVDNLEESRKVLLERVFLDCNPQLKLRIRKTYLPRTWPCG